MTERVRPSLVGSGLNIRPGRPDDVEALRAILSEPSVARWWGEPATKEELEGDLMGDSDDVLLIIDIDGDVAGGIQYAEELAPSYRHASIDIFLGTRWQGRGYGAEALRLMARFLFDERGHHRLTIDPAADNARAIASYRKVGFRPVGIMRQYERHGDSPWHDGLLMDLLREER